MTKDDRQPTYNDLIGDILKKHEKEGGMDNLPSSGEPLSREYFSGDTFQHFQRIAKDAGYKPYWLELQHEISEDILNLKEIYKDNRTQNIEKELKKINEKIFEYNKTCPPPMQKAPITLNTLKNLSK